VTAGHFSRLTVQLALAFAAVAVAAVVASESIAVLTVAASEKQLVTRQSMMLANSIAVSSALTYAPEGWARDLTPVIVTTDRAGAGLLVRDASGREVRAQPQYSAPINVGGRKVGSVTIRHSNRGISTYTKRFEAERWRARITGGAVGALLAVLVGLTLGRRLTTPLRSLLRAARARARGDRSARVGPVHGFSDVREVATTFDQMADVLNRQDQLRRNLVADVAHQLRTPTAVLQAGTEAMLDGLVPLTLANVESLQEETVRLGRMIDDLQRLSAAEAAAVQLVSESHDLAACASNAADSLSDIFETSGVQLQRRLGPVTVQCDQRRMHDIITNLLTNAVKFTPRGGQVIIGTHLRGATAVLSVTDTGMGIPADELPHVAERFFRGSGSSVSPGSGIGLAIVDELVRAQRGTLEISSGPGDGTEAVLTFPRTERDGSQPSAGSGRLYQRKITAA
jgi:two-component system sensor histidine kinase BaeS